MPGDGAEESPELRDDELGAEVGDNEPLVQVRRPPNADVEQRIATLEASRQAAELEGDTLAEAEALCELARLHERVSANDPAREAYTRARFLFEMGGDGVAAANVIIALGNLEGRLRRMEGAARLYREAADLFQRKGEPRQAADALLSEADAFVKLGRQDTAIERIQAANTLFAQLDDTLGMAHTAYRQGMLSLTTAPESADEQLELAARLFGDHVSRDVDQIDVALPDAVSDSRRYPPFVMQRICLRERQKLGGGPRGAQVPSRTGSARRLRSDGDLGSGPQSSSLTTLIGIGLLVVGGLVLLGPQLASEGGPLEDLAQALGGAVSAATLLHLGIGLFGAVTGMVAAQQIGISAPVVLLALAVGVGMIFHEVGRAVFPGASSSSKAVVTEAAKIEDEAMRLGRAEAAEHLIDARTLLQRENVGGARAKLEAAYGASKEIIDPKGQVRALEELLALERQYGTTAEQLAAAERLYDDLRGFDDERGREVLEEIVGLSTRLDDHPRLRDTQMKLLANYERVGDTAGEVTALLALAALDRDAKDLEGAYEWFRRAHAGYQTLRDAEGQLGTLLAMGDIDSRMGRRRRAYGRYYDAFALYRELDDTAGQAAMLLNMGAIDEALERYEEATAAFRQAERLFESVGDRPGQALAALRFGSTQVTHGNQRQAREGFLRSLEMYDALDDVGGQARAHFGLGNHWLKVGDREEAIRHYELARDLFGRVNEATGQLAALREIAIIAHEAGNEATAGSRLDEARRVSRDVADPTTRAGMLLSAGDLALSLERVEAARDTYREAMTLYEAIGDDPGRRAADQRLSRLQSAG